MRTSPNSQPQWRPLVIFCGTTPSTTRRKIRIGGRALRFHNISFLKFHKLNKNNKILFVYYYFNDDNNVLLPKKMEHQIICFLFLFCNLASWKFHIGEVCSPDWWIRSSDGVGVWICGFENIPHDSPKIYLSVEGAGAHYFPCGPDVLMP